MARYVGVDDLFLLRLAAGDGIAESLVDATMAAGYHIIIPPAAYQAIQDEADKAEDSDARNFACMALSNINVWGFLSLELTDTQKFYTDRAAERMIEAGILAESSLSKARMITQLGADGVHTDLFITGHSELCGTNTYLLHFIVQSRDLRVFPVKEVDALYKEIMKLQERMRASSGLAHSQ